MCLTPTECLLGNHSQKHWSSVRIKLALDERFLLHTVIVLQQTEVTCIDHNEGTWRYPFFGVKTYTFTFTYIT